MAIKKGDFFAKKRDWSKLKDQILDHYLAPYLAKITTTGRPTRIVDCFAGKGRFDDGQDGSPLIIAKQVASMLARAPSSDVKAVFIEQKYAAQLEVNLVGAPGCKVISGDYEQCISRFLSEHVKRDRNYLFYVDPYGIKSLDFGHFARLKKVGFQSLEMLINLNSTGFLREGCRLLSLTRAVPDWADDLDYETDGKNTPARMDEIAGGNYWRTILAAFQSDTINFHEAEEEFIAAYTKRLGNHLKYVINIPIKERSCHMPKYRLVFATAHHDGFFLMTEIMNKAWHTLLTREAGGQLFLFNDEQWAHTQGPSIEDKIWEEAATSTELAALLIRLIDKNGIAYSPSEYVAAIRKYEGKRFHVRRKPETTPTGLKARHLDYNLAHIVVKRMPYAQEFLDRAGSALELGLNENVF